jgi:hypothetical protein
MIHGAPRFTTPTVPARVAVPLALVRSAVLPCTAAARLSLFSPTALRCPPQRRLVGAAAEQRDELAPFHVAPLPWQLAQQLLRNAYDVVFTVI